MNDMNNIGTENIESWIRSLGVENFIGVLSRDEVLKVKGKTGYAMAYLNPSYWVAFSLGKNNNTYFDGFGMPPFEEYVKIVDGTYSYNSTQYEPSNSNASFHLATYWLHEISKGASHYDIVSRFDVIYPYKNHELVAKWFDNMN